MIVVRFKVQCLPERTDEVASAMTDVVAPSREMPGVIHFDVARDVTDSNSLIATQVFEDRATMRHHESTHEMAKVIDLAKGGALAAPLEWTLYDVADAEWLGD